MESLPFSAHRLGFFLGMKINNQANRSRIISQPFWQKIKKSYFNCSTHCLSQSKRPCCQRCVLELKISTNFLKNYSKLAKEAQTNNPLFSPHPVIKSTNFQTLVFFTSKNLGFSTQKSWSPSLGYSKFYSSRHRTVFSANSSATPALRGNGVNMNTIDLGNNESPVYGVFPNQDGTFTAITYTKSKTFKTEAGARRWLGRHSGE